MVNNKTAILFNPSAGGGKALEKKNKLEDLLSRLSIPYDIFVTKSGEHLKSLSRELISRYSKIVGAGGDSTFSLIVNELMLQKTDVCFGIIGLGSSNDISLEFGLQDMETACLAIKKGRFEKTDIGCIENQGKNICYFLGQANLGLGVYVNQYIEKLSFKKSLLAKNQKFAGMIGILRTIQSQNIPLSLRIESADKVVEEKFHAVVFGNIRYWATGFQIFQDAQTNDGLLDGCLIRSCSFRKLVQIAYQIRRKGASKTGNPEFLKAESFKVSSEKKFFIQADGEILKKNNRLLEFTKVSFRIIPSCLNFIY